MIQVEHPGPFNAFVELITTIARNRMSMSGLAAVEPRATCPGCRQFGQVDDSTAKRAQWYSWTLRRFHYLSAVGAQTSINEGVGFL